MMERFHRSRYAVERTLYVRYNRSDIMHRYYDDKRFSRYADPWRSVVVHWYGASSNFPGAEMTDFWRKNTPKLPRYVIIIDYNVFWKNDFRKNRKTYPCVCDKVIFMPFYQRKQDTR